MCLLRCSRRTNARPHPGTSQTCLLSRSSVARAFRPRLFFVSPGTGTGISPDRRRFLLGLGGPTGESEISPFTEADWLASALCVVWFDTPAVPILLLEGVRLVYSIEGAQAHLSSLCLYSGHRGIAKS